MFDTCVPVRLDMIHGPLLHPCIRRQTGCDLVGSALFD